MLLALGGCSQRGVPIDAEQARQYAVRQQQISAYESWDMLARIVVRRPREVYNIGLQWKQDGERFSMLLAAPMGQGVFRIDGAEGSGYRLRLPDGREFSNRTPEALLDEVIGWSLPVSGMKYWIRGLPRPGADYRSRRDDHGGLRRIRQDSWDIEITDYFDAGEEPRLPRRINLAQDELNIKFVIERWQQSEAEQVPSDLFPEFN